MAEGDGHGSENGQSTGYGRTSPRSTGYLLFVWSPAGYSLRQLDGEPPAVGHEFEVENRTLVVTKIGPSPFPADSRPCLFSLGRS